MKIRPLVCFVLGLQLKYMFVCYLMDLIAALLALFAFVIHFIAVKTLAHVAIITACRLVKKNGVILGLNA